jgi:hypothetical protein
VAGDNNSGKEGEGGVLARAVFALLCLERQYLRVWPSAHEQFGGRHSGFATPLHPLIYLEYILLIYAIFICNHPFFIHFCTYATPFFNVLHGFLIPSPSAR